MQLSEQRDEAIIKMNEECRPLLAALIAKSTEYDNHTKEQAKEFKVKQLLIDLFNDDKALLISYLSDQPTTTNF